MRMAGLIAGGVVGLTLLLSGSASATLVDLAGDPNGMGIPWQGEKRFISDFYDVLAVDIQYCVYAPGQFALSFPGEDPSGGSEYVYAYEVANDIAPHPVDPPFDPGYVTRFSVGLNDEDEQAANIGFVDGAGQNPNASFLVPRTAGWDFTSPTLNYVSTSDVLLFTSPFPPELDTATVSGGAHIKTENLPSPTPEPATFALLAVGAAVALARRRRGALG